MKRHSDTKLEIMMCGIGGHGVVAAAKLLAVAAGLDGCQVQSFSEYGWARRGGRVESYIRISQDKILSHSKMYEPDYIVIFDPAQLDNKEIINSLKKQGGMLINTPLSARDFPNLSNYKVATIDAVRGKTVRSN